MDSQTIWSLALAAPAVAVAVMARRAVREQRTAFGLQLRNGAIAEFGKGALFSVPFLLAILAIYWTTGLSDPSWTGRWAGPIGIAIYFLVLFVIEEIVFRGLLMTGLGVLVGQTLSWLMTAILVAGAYLFAPHTGVLAMIGAVVTNLLTGLARWRSGRIWWGLGQRWLWNSGLVALGFSDSAYHLDHPLFTEARHHAVWLNGGAFGVEAGAVGIALQIVMLALVYRAARGSYGPWRVLHNSNRLTQPRPRAKSEK